jgi:Na+/citrate or Na+/malate symporter
MLVDEKIAAGYDRSAMIIGLGCAFIMVMMIDVLVTNLNDPIEAESLIFVLATVGIIVCAALSFAIIGFNRPKFLVPPCHRGEMGAFAPGRRPAGRRTR